MGKRAIWEVKTVITTSVIETGCLWWVSFIDCPLRGVDFSRTKLAEIRLYGIKLRLEFSYLLSSILLRLPIVHGELARDVFICLSSVYLCERFA